MENLLIAKNDRATGASTRVHTTTLRSGIEPSFEFAKKGFASYAVNVGTKCGHVLLPHLPHLPSLNPERFAPRTLLNLHRS
jgi:hypothetical protein